MVSHYKKNGTLNPVQGRPVIGIGSSMSASLQVRILYYRDLYPSWGGKSIKNELVHQDGYSPEDLPSVRTIGRFLKSRKLTAKHAKNVPLPNEKLAKVSQVHECWQMDDKGPECYEGIGYVGMINIKDVYSSTYVGSRAISLWHTRCHPNITDYQYALRLAFSEFGLPKSIQADHGSNFYENKAKSPFPTILHLWLVGLGVNLVWANAYRPTDQATVERSHQVTHNQNNRTKAFKNMQDFQEHVDKRRRELNENIYCDTFQKPPLKAFPEALHSKTFYNPLTEATSFPTKRIDHYLADKKWFRKVSSNHTLSIGGQIYYLPKAKKLSELAVTFDDKTRHLIFRDDKELIASLPIKGIDFESIAGKNYANRLKNKQLEIPLDWETVKINTTLCPNNFT